MNTNTYVNLVETRQNGIEKLKQSAIYLEGGGTLTSGHDALYKREFENYERTLGELEGVRELFSYEYRPEAKVELEILIKILHELAALQANSLNTFFEASIEAEFDRREK